jgi:hypothetical protein
MAPAPTPGRLLAGRDAPYLHTDEVADLLNRAAGGATRWDARKVRRWLLAGGAVVRLPKALGRQPPKRRTVVTTLSKLRDVYPEMYDEILRSLPEDELEARLSRDEDAEDREAREAREAREDQRGPVRTGTTKRRTM